MSFLQVLVAPNFIGVCAIAIFIVFWAKFSRRRRQLPSAPYISVSDLPGSAGVAADIKAYVENGSKVMQKGWDKYSKQGKHYLMRTPTDTFFVVAPQFTEEIRSLPDSKLSALKANNETMQFRHTLHPLMEENQYHNLVVQKQLTQSLGPSLPDIIDEAKKSFGQELGTFQKPSIIEPWDYSFRIVTRTANRLLFGENLSGNKEFLRLSVDFSVVMFGGADIIRNYPEFMKPVIMWWKTDYYKTMARLRALLVPIIKERLGRILEHERSGTWSQWLKEKPNDAIQWVLDITQPKDRNPEVLLYRMLHINIAAVHTSSVTFLDCLYELAGHPEIHDELREEITNVFAKDGNEWRKQGLTKLHKMDSFMRETVRFNPLFSSNLDRVAVDDVRLSDGTLVPKGTLLTVPSLSMYMDEDYYPNAKTFDAFRFARKRLVPGEESNHSFVQTQATYLHFGHGKHACPGRFFASNEIKILLIFLLMNYDVRLPSGESKPEGIWFTKGRTPNPKGRVQLQSRLDVPSFARI